MNIKDKTWSPSVVLLWLASITVLVASSLRAHQWLITRSIRDAMSIPESSDFVQGDTITVQLGDTLYGLAKQHLGDGARWKELADYNGIANPSRLQVGAVLVVPR